MDIASVEAFEREFAVAVARMGAAGCRPGGYLTLVDVREQGVQSGEVAARLQEFIARNVAVSRRTAVVLSGSTLHKMQARRIAASPNDARVFFLSEDEALAWLFAKE